MPSPAQAWWALNALRPGAAAPETLQLLALLYGLRQGWTGRGPALDHDTGAGVRRRAPYTAAAARRTRELFLKLVVARASFDRLAPDAQEVLLAVLEAAPEAWLRRWREPAARAVEGCLEPSARRTAVARRLATLLVADTRAPVAAAPTGGDGCGGSRGAGRARGRMSPRRAGWGA